MSLCPLVNSIRQGWYEIKLQKFNNTPSIDEQYRRDCVRYEQVCEHYEKNFKEHCEQYENDYKEHCEQSEKDYVKTLRGYEAKCAKFEVDKAEVEREKYYYNQKITIYERLFTEYETRLVEYKAETISVLKDRELLWERARVCMRCGTAYFSY